MKCEDCKWWDRSEDTKRGLCCKNAPRTIVAGCGVGESPKYENDWACTDLDNWCGEFKSKGANRNEV